jgi:anti-anti-sigma factor
MVTIKQVRTGSISVVTASGEIDLVSGPRLRALLDEVLDDLEPRTADLTCVVLDLTAVSFIGSAGLGVLVDAHERATQRGIALKVVIGGPASPVARALQAAGIDEHLDVHPSVASARPAAGHPASG